MNEVEEAIRSIISKSISVRPEDVLCEGDLIVDLGADSVDLIDILMSIEDHFDIEIPDSKLEKVRTLNDFKEIVDNM